MANYVPFIGGTGTGDATNAPAGGFLLPPEQGEILVKGLLVETGAIQLAGDARATSARKTNFPIWLGQPDAAFVGEGATKPVTGASFDQVSLNIKKVATIVVFTDEMIEDLQNGDLNVLVDAGVRQALSKRVDQAAISDSQFDSCLIAQPGVQSQTTGGVQPVNAGVVIGSDTVTNVDDRLQKAISAAMGVLETNGYGDPNNIGVLLGFGWQQTLRDARMTDGRPLYDGGTFAGQSIDALYGLSRAHSTALANAARPAVAVTAYTAPNATVASTAGIFVGAPVQTSGSTVGYVKTITDATHVVVSDASGNNLTGTTVTSSSLILSPQAVVVHKPNLHVRVRSDVSVATSNEATLALPTGGQEGGGTASVSLFQNNLFAARYEMRLGFLVHDPSRAIVPIWA
jgi:hypothetical protein